MNRFNLICPVCKGKNKIEWGGNKKCFHCACGWMECGIRYDSLWIKFKWLSVRINKI